MEIIERLIEPSRRADLVACWSFKRRKALEWHRKTRRPLLIMERGHFQPRFSFTSCGFNGIGRNAVYPAAIDDRRWRKHFSHHLRPWQEPRDLVVVIGQVQGDAALAGTDGKIWARETVEKLRARGHRVVFRPHPNMTKRGDKWRPGGCDVDLGPLSETLSWAGLFVTYSSTSAVEAALAGVPVVAIGKGSMAWDVAAHTLDEAPARPDRTAWAHWLAYTTWSLSEIESGETWDHLRHVLPEAHTHVRPDRDVYAGNRRSAAGGHRSA